MKFYFTEPEIVELALRVVLASVFNRFNNALQGRPDLVHDYRGPNGIVDLNEPDRFVANYRKAGGEIELLHLEYETRQALSTDPQIAFFRSSLVRQILDH